MFVKLWMTPAPLITIRPEQNVVQAQACLQENNIRRIPVVDADGRLVGIISQRDIMNIMPSTVDGSSARSSFLADATKVGDIMARQPMCVEPLTPLETVARSMRQHKIGGMPVVEDGRLVGIITESDIFAAFMEVLGAGGEGARIEMIIGKSSRDLYNVIDIFKKYDIFIQAITVHHDFGDNQRLLTIRVLGDELDEMLDALRRSGARINRIQLADTTL